MNEIHAWIKAVSLSEAVMWLAMAVLVHGVLTKPRSGSKALEVTTELDLRIALAAIRDWCNSKR